MHGGFSREGSGGALICPPEASLARSGVWYLLVFFCPAEIRLALSWSRHIIRSSVSLVNIEGDIAVALVAVGDVTFEETGLSGRV